MAMLHFVAVYPEVILRVLLNEYNDCGKQSI